MSMTNYPGVGLCCREGEKKKQKTPKNTKKHNKHMLQHMLIETASYPSADKSMINDPK